MVCSKNSWGVRVVAVVQFQEKLGIFTLIKAWKVFPELKLPENCYIMNIGSPTDPMYIYIYNTYIYIYIYIYTLPERQSSQSDKI